MVFHGLKVGDSTGLPISLAKCTATGTNHAREEPEHFQNDSDVDDERKNVL